MDPKHKTGSPTLYDWTPSSRRVDSKQGALEKAQGIRECDRWSPSRRWVDPKQVSAKKSQAAARVTRPFFVSNGTRSNKDLIFFNIEGNLAERTDL
jgi:hypothetical protein